MGRMETTGKTVAITRALILMQLMGAKIMEGRTMEVGRIMEEGRTMGVER